MYNYDFTNLTGLQGYILGVFSTTGWTQNAYYLMRQLAMFDLSSINDDESMLAAYQSFVVQAIIWLGEVSKSRTELNNNEDVKLPDSIESFLRGLTDD